MTNAAAQPTCVWRTGRTSVCGQPATHAAIHPLGDDQPVCSSHAHASQAEFGCALRPLSGGDVLRVRRPCDECPWRRDATLGRFPTDRFEQLRVTVGRPGAEALIGAPLFACHKTPERGERACAGWLAVEGHRHLGVRYAVAVGRLDAAALAPRPGWPALYSSFAEMTAAQTPAREVAP